VQGPTPLNRTKLSSDDSVAVSESLDEFKEEISESMLSENSVVNTVLN
jgi:hypothetical protein